MDDLVGACLFLMNLDHLKFERLCYSSLPLINIGCGEDRTIREVASLISEVVGFKGEVKWDMSKPDGMSRKLLDISRVLNLGWKPKISLIEGIKITYESFLEQHSRAY